jgi:N-acetylmuramoyl-L-alanine amidase
MKKIRILVIAVFVCMGICASRAVLQSVSGTTMKEAEKYVIVDAGHGGVDSGKVGVNGVLEKDLNLTIAKKLKKLLEQEGIRADLTRTDDSGLYEEDSTRKKADDLKNRCQIINDGKPDLAVSIHQNSYTDASVYGAQVFYYTHSVTAKDYAGIFQQCLSEVDPTNNRQAKANDTYYLLRRTEVPVLIAECGFLSNPDEAEKLTDEDYQDQLAKALCRAVKNCLQTDTATDGAETEKAN